MPPSAYHLAMERLERRALSADQNVLMAHLVVWLLALVSGILLALRLFTKWLRAQQLWSDDGFLIASWVSHTRPFPSEPFPNAFSKQQHQEEANKLTANKIQKGRHNLLLGNNVPGAGPGGRPPAKPPRGGWALGAPPAGQRRPQPGPDGRGVEQDLARLHAAAPAVAAPYPRRAVLGRRPRQRRARGCRHRPLAAVQAHRRGLGQRRGHVLEHRRAEYRGDQRAVFLGCYGPRAGGCCVAGSLDKGAECWGEGWGRGADGSGCAVSSFSFKNTRNKTWFSQKK